MFNTAAQQWRGCLGGVNGLPQATETQGMLDSVSSEGRNGELAFSLVPLPSHVSQGMDSLS